MSKSTFGVRARLSSPEDKRELRKAAEAVVQALGFEDFTDAEAAGILYEHAQKLKRYRVSGNVNTLVLSPPSTQEIERVDLSVKVAGEVRVEASDLRSYLGLLGLPVLQPEDLPRLGEASKLRSNRRVQWGARLGMSLRGALCRL
ncbi:hypothetical protein [Armatimonas sp.]|uniref:hypothetical protein n=1 Tax=Armatimonas sp. TaxID=1872638 RepID=UPI0037501BD5